MECLITPSNLPRSGVLIVTINFKNYKDSNANDCRRSLEQFPEIAKKENVEVKLTPLNYWLGRTIVEGVTRATAGSWRFGFSNMNVESFKALQEILMEMQSNHQWWEEPELLVADWVEI